VTLSDIAKRSAVSISTVKPLFFNFLGVSPIKYYSLLQIDEAKRLLNEGLTVSEISEKMNFSSPNYFCSFFKRMAGCTPSKYRKTE
jgi:AraC-like DNA-binding protein